MTKLKKITIVAQHNDSVDLIQAEVPKSTDLLVWLEEWERVHMPSPRHKWDSFNYTLIGVIDGLVVWSKEDFAAACTHCGR